MAERKRGPRRRTRANPSVRATRQPAEAQTDAYDHKDKEALLRPDVGLQAQFKQKKPPKKYRYDPSLDPALSWDQGNPVRERGEALIRRVQDATTLEEAKAAAGTLARMSSPFLNWTGKAERAEFDVPTLPLFIHERLSTQAILQTLKGRKRDRQQNLFADVELDITDRILKAYVHKAPWVNRLILGDSLVVMNSLLQYEGLGGQVQMIYVDPPYGVKFGSNFQPFVRKRDVKHGDDADLTREPEMVQAYRDTWELGLHSYLTYLRDRLLLCRELLHPSGSIFVQISDENLHHVREVMDEVFGTGNFCSVICFVKTSGFSPVLLSNISDYLLLMTTDPGDLVLDPTCGSGTTAYVAEQWGGAGSRLTQAVSPLPWPANACLPPRLATTNSASPRKAPRGALSTSVSRIKRAKRSAESSRISPSRALRRTGRPQKRSWWIDLRLPVALPASLAPSS